MGIGDTWQLSKQFVQGEITSRVISCYKKLKVSPFVKFEMIQPFLRYLLDPKEVQQGMGFYDKFYG